MSQKITCKICKKEYASQQSLCNHSRIKHNMTPVYKKPVRKHSMQSQEASENIQSICNNTTNLFKCNFCDNTYKHRQSKTKHMRTCAFTAGTILNDTI